ncbi:MAG: hypothetical protein HYY14_04395 [Candidatus Omnitrophica bacterium]|nr:hypothetical protein [Candidatus Omnitrophota bacterium]
MNGWEAVFPSRFFSLPRPTLHVTIKPMNFNLFHFDNERFHTIMTGVVIGLMITLAFHILAAI